MKITYDENCNIGYITLRERSVEVQTIQISDEMNIDLSPDGKVYGIELLNATEQLKGGLGGMLTFVNENSGTVTELQIPA